MSARVNPLKSLPGVSVCGYTCAEGSITGLDILSPGGGGHFDFLCLNVCGDCRFEKVPILKDTSIDRYKTHA